MTRLILSFLLIIVTLAGCGSPERRSDDTRGSERANITPGNSGPAIKWRLASTFPSTLLIIGTMGKAATTEIRSLTDGKVDIHFHEPGVLAPPFETFDAVRYGAVEAGWSTSGYWAGKEPALQLFSAVPFGPGTAEYLAWYENGGGRALFEAIYRRHNIHALICGISPPEASGWFKREIKSVKDFEGLRIRFFGLGAKVLEKLGASPQLIAGGEIYQALELGAIDASEYSMPAVDERLGLNEVADYYYFPGWHQQSTFYELIINLDAWKTLSALQQRQIEAACAVNIRRGIAEGEALQPAALARLESKGTQIRRLPPDVLEALEDAWIEVAKDLSEKDPVFREAWTSLQDFRDRYALWSDLGYLKD